MNMQQLTDEELLELRKLATRYCLLNYDFCYFSAMHYKNRMEDIQTIIVGSSHAMNGIVEDVFDVRPVNFSISSQDIFYCYEHIKKAVNESKGRIKNCIIDLGYYALYQDVSLSKKIGKALIPRVYMPLFENAHHYQEALDYDMLQMLSYDRMRYDDALVRSVCEQWAQADMLNDPTYYGKRRSREKNSRCFLEGNVWLNISEEKREQIAAGRAEEHNRLKKYIATKQENIVIIKEMVEFMVRHNIRVVFVVFPFTSYYNRFIDFEYKTEIYDVLNEIEYSVEFLDMNELDSFGVEDFVDSDHLNYRGAVKASRILNSYLNLQKCEE